jgi:DNA-binding transcriptional LysR family regulator
MEFRQLEHFVAAADELQFTRAAQRVHVAQSTLSASIRALERDLGVPLFRRTTRRVELTDAGRVFAADARRVLAVAAEARAGVQKQQGVLSGRLSIGTGQYVGVVDVAKLLASFCAQHPGVEIRLRQGAASALAEEVHEGRLDLVLAAMPSSLPSSLAATPLGAVPMVLACARGHRLGQRRRVRLDELFDETFVDFPPGWAARVTVESIFLARGIYRRVAFEVDDIIGLLNLVAHDLGIAIVPGGFASIAAEVAYIRIASPPVLRYAAITQRGQQMSAASQSFVAMALTSVQSTAVRPVAHRGGESARRNSAGSARS